MHDEIKFRDASPLFVQGIQHRIAQVGNQLARINILERVNVAVLALEIFHHDVHILLVPVLLDGCCVCKHACDARPFFGKVHPPPSTAERAHASQPHTHMHMDATHRTQSNSLPLRTQAGLDHAHRVHHALVESIDVSDPHRLGVLCERKRACK